MKRITALGSALSLSLLLSSAVFGGEILTPGIVPPPPPPPVVEASGETPPESTDEGLPSMDLLGYLITLVF